MNTPYNKRTLYIRRKMGLFLANKNYPANLKTRDYTLRKGDKDAQNIKES